MENQKIAFFSGKWNKFDDNAFLTHLEFFANMDGRVIKKSNRAVFEAVCDWINPKPVDVGGNLYIPMPLYTITDCYRRYELAELRFNTWKQIIEYQGVQYHARTNTIRASDKVWDEICEMYSLGKAYRWEPEYRWTELQAIFCPFAVRGLGGNADNADKVFEKTLDELFHQIGRDTETEVIATDDSEDDDILGLFPIIPPDVMSTTKGKGHILYDPVAKPISPSLRFPKKPKEQKKRGSTSGVVRSIEF